MIAIFFVLVIAIIIFAIFQGVASNQRRIELQQFAVQNGMSFHPDKDYSLDESYPFIAKLCQGRNRYGYNIIRGTFQNHPVIFFDYHYETKSKDSKGKTKTNHHYFSFMILNYDQMFPELLIFREGWFSKLAQWLGYADIDFESAEFSRKFIVRSPDKKFAYDVCHAKMMEYLLLNDDLNLEMERDCLTLSFPILSVEKIEFNLQRIVMIREMFPNYLMEA